MINWLKEHTIFTIVIVLLILGIYYFFIWEPNNKRYEECLKNTLYRPEKQAYTWKFEFVEEYFKTPDEAMRNCMQTLKRVGF